MTPLEAKLKRPSFLGLFRTLPLREIPRYFYARYVQRRDLAAIRLRGKRRGQILSAWALGFLHCRQKWVEEDLYLWKIAGKVWMGSLEQIHGLYPLLTGAFTETYGCEYTGKTVLDIGGFIGDSARFALGQGAKEVIVYEPLPKNLQCLAYNLKPYASKVIIEGIAVGTYDGTFIERFETLLTRQQADIAKVNCEGAERHLLKVPHALLRKIPYWMIKTQLRAEMDAHFTAAGFESQEHGGAVHYRLKDG